MIKMKLASLAFFPLAMAAQPAIAQEGEFEGVSATIIGGIDATRIAGSNETGAAYGAQLGYDIASGNLVIGIEGEVGDATVENCFAASGFCVNQGRDIYAGGRLGTVMGSTLLYLKAGYTNARQTFDYEVTVPVQPPLPRSAIVEGWRAGLGVEHMIGGSFHIKAEYRYSNYGDGFSRHQGLIGIGTRF